MAAKVVRDKRIGSRKRKSVFRKFLVFLWAVFALAVFIGILWGLNYFYNSDYFKVKYIEVANNNFYSSDEIESYLETVKGMNIFEVDKKQVESSIESNFHRIKTAELQKVFPDKLKIVITERLPYIRISYKNKIFLIDEEGIFMEDITEVNENYKNLVLVNDSINYMPEIGDILAKKNILSIGQIFDSMSKELKSIIESAGVTKDSFGDIFFNTSNNKKILYGDASEMTKKNLILEQILKDIENEGISYNIIDIRITDNPIIK